MTSEHRDEEAVGPDEGSWIYLCASGAELDAERSLVERVVEACEKSGWSAVSWSPAPSKAEMDPGRFFQGVGHAVGHADVVIALIDGESDLANAELALAYSHRRPIVGVRLSTGSASPLQSWLAGYERARTIDCSDPDECFHGLREVLADPDFAETVRQAAGEGFEHV
ncbi:MAG TPA: hypothetical protein VFX45_09535 [Solirubrobacterales bacterium]|nr:hypothetical protein [Solirubrobacterales bacterium]